MNRYAGESAAANACPLGPGKPPNVPRDYVRMIRGTPQAIVCGPSPAGVRGIMPLEVIRINPDAKAMEASS
jgi:hypothetical protein